MELSVVVPIYIKEKEHLGMSVRCIELAREKTKLPYELVIVETCSDYLKDYADVHIYEKEKINSSKSINRGFKCSTGEYIVLLTNDVFVETDWLECLLDCFKIPDCGMATVASSELGHKKENKIIEGIWCPLMMIPRHIFNKVGYLDEEYLGRWDDTDLLLRVYKAGYKMYRNFNCVVKHLVGATTYNEINHKELCRRGMMMFNEKYNGCELPIFEVLR